MEICGDMWRYVERCLASLKIESEICGDMWRYGEICGEMSRLVEDRVRVGDGEPEGLICVPVPNN